MIKLKVGDLTRGQGFEFLQVVQNNMAWNSLSDFKGKNKEFFVKIEGLLVSILLRPTKKANIDNIHFEKMKQNMVEKGKQKKHKSPDT